MGQSISKTVSTRAKKRYPKEKKLQPKQPKLFRDIEAPVLNRKSKTQGFQTEIEGSVRTHNAAKRPSKGISKPKQELIVP